MIQTTVSPPARLGLAAAALGLLLAAAPSAHAQSVLLTFVQPQQSVSPGSPVTFSGTITNNSANDEYLNGFDFGAGPDFGGVGLTANADTFFNITPYKLLAGASTGIISLFTVTADPGTPAGSYLNVFNIEGGTTAGDNTQLGGAEFTVNVPRGAPVPEASTTLSLGLLLALGLGGVAAAKRRRTV